MLPQFIRPLPVQPPFAAVFRRLQMPPDAGLESEMLPLFHTLSPWGAFLQLNLCACDPDAAQVALQNGDVIPSAGVARMLRGCTQAVYLAAGAGDISPHGARLRAAGDMRGALLLDAVAAQTADAGLSMLQGMLSGRLMRMGFTVTVARFSAGYGDLPLSYQRVIYRALELERMDVQMLPSYMLQPEKTVLAIAGVKPLQSQSRRDRI